MKKFLTLLISLVLLLQPGLASMNGASAQVRGCEHQSLDAVTHFVKPVATGTGTCASWVDACELQTALGIAVSSDEIWVQAGMYMPTTGADRAATFSLKSGVALYGGFLGTETNREQRDWAANVTALSGDIGVVGDNSDNSYHVVTGSGTDATAILDGFTIILGNANGANPFDCGGGMYNNNGNPTLTNVTFSGNTAIDGGGMFNLNGSSPSLANVVFSANSAYYGYGLGGGMTNLEHSNPSLTGVAFRDNTANDGGGLYNDSSDPTITNAIFNTNSASGAGGGMFNYSSSPTMVNVTFSDNTGRSNGGGMFNDTSSPRVTEVAFYRNLADSGGGMYIDGGEPVLVDVALRGESRRRCRWGDVHLWRSQTYTDGCDLQRQHSHLPRRRDK